ncbi:uncharacterized protein [Nicotiana sylvestris]|uniref:uncharacterized protein n=1 Tax=Nicotiana sylvestris TaxID=4096 RepID=UPI00388C92DD
MAKEELEEVRREMENKKAMYADRVGQLEASLTQKEMHSSQLIDEHAKLGEVAAKDAEILELRRQNEIMTLERDLSRGELASNQALLRSTQKEVTALYVAKAGTDEDASSYKRDTVTANARAKEISEKAEQKLARAIAYAHLRARR